MKNKKYIKKTAVFFLTFLCVVSCTACKDNEKDDTTKTDEASKETQTKEYVKAKEIVDNIVAGVKGLPQMTFASMEDEYAQDTFEYLCDIDYSLVEDYYISYSNDANESPAEEILVIRLKSEKDARDNVKCLEDRIARRKNQFMQYMPSVLPVVNKAKVSQKDCYLALFVCEDSNNAKNLFDSQIDTM